MKKKSFVLSWGRKMFFGLGWLLTSLVALNYLQSMIVPQSASGWIYFLTTFVGQYGLILSLVYFLIYVPVITLFPSYYISKIWSTVLILLINLFIFFDSYLFITYRFHINSFLWKFLQEENALESVGLSSFKLGMIGFVTAVLFVILWLRGERLWRRMQARFSNPVSNWYLVIIVICFVSSQLMYSSNISKGNLSITRLASVFPIHFSFNSEVVKTNQKDSSYKDFYYPASPMICGMKNPKNVLMIVLDKWNVSELNEIQTPNLFHYASHGINFKNHFSGGLDKNDGYFSLLYSLPPIYAQSALNQSSEPVALELAKKAKMDLNFFQFGSPGPLPFYRPDEKEISIDYLESTLLARDEHNNVNPFFMQVFLGGESLVDKDNNAKNIVNLFIKHKLIKDSIIIITGTHGDHLRTPLIMIWPGKAPVEVTKLTSHYDVLPTVLMEDWRCKNSLRDFTLGKNLFSEKVQQQFVAGDYLKLQMVDLSDSTLTTIDQGQDVEVVDLMSFAVKEDKKTETVLKQLKLLTRFFNR